MTDALSRCVLFKGLPTGATLNDLVTGLDKRNLSVLEAHSSHIENGRDKIWVVLFSSSEVARECIKQGSWKVNLRSGEITLSPDYCSEYIVPDNWIQKFEDLDEQNSDESRSIPKEDFTGRCHSLCNERPAMTPILGANVQTVDTDVHDELASDEYIESSSTEKIYQHTKCSPVAREFKSKTQELNIQTPWIRVMGLAKSVSMNTLEMFFENKKRCGGGEIERMELGRNKREAFITFKDSSVVQSILKKQEREPFYLDKMNLTVQEYFPPPTDPLRLFLTNLSPKVNLDLLGLYLEPCCKAIPIEIIIGRNPGTALVSFSEPPDVEQLLRQVKEKALEGQYIEVTRVPVTQSVQVTGLKQTTSRDIVELYFEHKKCSGGGPVADVRFGRDKQSCVVLFENAEDAERVCKRPHTIDKQEDIQVCLYYDCFLGDLDGEQSSDVTQETESRVDVQETFLSLDPVRIKFIKAYKMEDIKVVEKNFESLAVEVSVIDSGDQKGVKIIGTKDGCEGAKTTLAEMAKNIITKKHVMVNKVGLTELLQSARGKDQLSFIASSWKCFIAVKASVIPRNLQLEASKGPAAAGKSSKKGSDSNRLVFSITKDSESNFKSAVMSLESFVKSEITEKEINSPRKIILELLDRQVTKMEGMGQGGTLVSVCRQKGVIQVSGSHKELLETYESVMKYLHNIERDMMKAEQENLIAQATSDLSLPSMWTSMAPNEDMKCVTLNPGDKEYETILQKFRAVCQQRLTVIKIERVQNRTLYLQYKAKKKQIETKNNGVANEKELWHGTAGNNIANINNNGFNRSYGGSGSHGAGIYFAVNASYSVSFYCMPDASDHLHIYLANVLIGDSVAASFGTRVLPPKDPSNPDITYDSTTDNTRNPKLFVIFHDTQAYPSYHITLCHKSACHIS